MLPVTAPLLLALLLLQDPAGPKGPEKVKVEFALSIAESGGEWRFLAEGATDLPDLARLKGRLYVLEEVDDFRGGKRVDEEPFDYEAKPVEIEVKGGKFSAVLLATPRKPYSLKYRAKLRYDPENQEEEVAAKVTEKEFVVARDLRRGDDAALEAEFKATAKEFAGEMDIVLELHRDQKRRFKEWIDKRPEKKAYADWYASFREKVEGLEERNRPRFMIWACWLERQGKMKLDAFCERFVRTAREFETWLESPSEEQLQVVKSALDAFLPAYEEAREVLGIDTPWDPDSVGAIVREYEKSLGALEEASASAAAWAAKGPAARLQARSCLMRLVSEKLVPRRAYDRVVELGSLFNELAALREAASGGDAARRAEAAAKAKDHAAKLDEFLRYAGLKK